MEFHFSTKHQNMAINSWIHVLRFYKEKGFSKSLIIDNLELSILQQQWKHQFFLE